MDRLPEAWMETKKKEQKMKKIMVATAALAMAFATLAADCGCNTCNTCSTDCVYAYEFILLAKSTEGKQVQKVVKSSCACECDTVCGSCCFRKPRMRKYAGFVAGITNGNAEEEDVKAGCASACTCLDFVKEGLKGACGEVTMDDVTGDNNVWGGQYFWDVRTKKAVNAALWFYQLDAIGYQSRETVEAVGNFALELEIPPAAEEEATTADEEGEKKVGFVTLAGFGKRGRRGNGVIMVKNLSGFFAGQLPVRCYDCAFNASTCGDTCTGSWALAWTVCSDLVYDEAGCGYGAAAGVADPNAGLTAAYGKWTLKWNATAAAKLTKSYAAATLVKPGYESHAGKDWFKELTGAPESDVD